MTKFHLSLRVSDLDQSIEFYSAFFGAAPHKVQPDYANFDLDAPPLKFAIHQGSFEKGGSLDHLGFQVFSSDELNAFKVRLQAAGLATFDENDAACCYARQDKIWAHDPDGNEWEIYFLTDDLEAERADDYSMPLAPAHRCCE